MPIQPPTTVGDDTPIEGGPILPAVSVAAATWALFAGLALIMVGNGLNGALLGLRSEAEGFGFVVSGLVMASFFAGFLAGTAFTEGALRRVGHIRVFAALAATASSAALVHALAVEPILWAVLRFVFGACIAGLYIVVESWLNDLASNATRARMLSVYMVVLMGGMSLGQLLLNVADPQSFRLFVVVSVLVSMALVPVTLSASSAPPLISAEPMGLGALRRVVPTGVVVTFFVGAGQGVLAALGAVYASSVGMSAGRLSVFVAAPMVGALVAQVPVGVLADRFARRGVMVVVGLAGLVSSSVLVVLPAGSDAAIVSMLFVGSSLFPLYSLTVAYVNDWLEPGQIMGASASIVRLNGVGAITGPLAAATLMGVFAANMFFVALASVHAAIVAFLLYRILVFDALPMERQQAYVPFPSRATGAAAGLLLRRPSARQGRRPRREAKAPTCAATPTSAAMPSEEPPNAP